MRYGMFKRLSFDGRFFVFEIIQIPVSCVDKKKPFGFFFSSSDAKKNLFHAHRFALSCYNFFEVI